LFRGLCSLPEKLRARDPTDPQMFLSKVYARVTGLIMGGRTCALIWFW